MREENSLSRGKILIFTRSLNMQDLLKRVIEAQFGIEVDILNGQVAHHTNTKGLRKTRKAIVRDQL